MNNRVNGVQEFGDAIGGNQADEMEGVANAQPFSFGDERVAQDAVANEHEANAWIVRENLGRGGDNVLVSFAVKQARDSGEGNFIVGQAEFSADHVARYGEGSGKRRRPCRYKRWNTGRDVRLWPRALARSWRRTH